MIYTDMQPSFNLSSRWKCDFFYALDGKKLNWYMEEPPTTDSRTVTFAVDLPFDAVIKRAWLTMDMTSPMTGSAVRRVNGISIPSSGEVDVDGIAADTVSFEAVFTFRANGSVYQNMDYHTATLGITNPTLHIEYTSASNPEGGAPSTVVGSLGTGLQLPRLLGSDFREVARLDPDRLQLTLNLQPLSTAIMQMGDVHTPVKVRDFVELFSPHGSAGLFRVKETSTRYGVNSGVTVHLEHALCTLGDSLTMGTQAMSASVAVIISTLLEFQNTPHWVLGDCDVPDDYELIYEYSYDNLLQAIMDITDMLPEEYAWEFDTTVHPFVMHLRKMPDDDACEGRLNRNLVMAALDVDASDYCTRVVPFGAGEGTDRVTLTNLIGTIYLDSAKADADNVVSKTITADDVFDALTLRDVAQLYLDKHDEPAVSVEIDAINLAEVTGEDMDSFHLGRVCRLALPDYGVTVRERVISSDWADVYGSPEDETVTLANKIRDASDEIAALMREATNSKLIGGSVSSEDHFARASGITPGSPFQITFPIAGYGNVLNVRAVYSCTSEGAKRTCTVLVDGTEIDAGDGFSVDITRYLAADENGVPLVGDHRVVLQPNTLNTATSEVECTVTVKTIEKR